MSETEEKQEIRDPRKIELDERHFILLFVSATIITLVIVDDWFSVLAKGCIVVLAGYAMSEIWQGMEMPSLEVDWRLLGRIVLGVGPVLVGVWLIIMALPSFLDKIGIMFLEIAAFGITAFAGALLAQHGYEIMHEALKEEPTEGEK